jgi:hypothetical protein
MFRGEPLYLPAIIKTQESYHLALKPFCALLPGFAILPFCAPQPGFPAAPDAALP